MIRIMSLSNMIQEPINEFKNFISNNRSIVYFVYSPSFLAIMEERESKQKIQENSSFNSVCDISFSVVFLMSI